MAPEEQDDDAPLDLPTAEEAAAMGMGMLELDDALAQKPSASAAPSAAPAPAVEDDPLVVTRPGLAPRRQSTLARKPPTRPAWVPLAVAGAVVVLLGGGIAMRARRPRVVPVPPPAAVEPVEGIDLGKVNLEIVTSPAGALVTIDGHAVGRTPLTREVLGETQLLVELSLEGFESVRAEFQPKDRPRFEVNLPPKGGGAE